MQAIKTTGLVKRYKNLTAVDDLNLEIKQGELFSLLGVNGAGKTTVIKMLSCLTKPSAGDAVIDGYSITREPELMAHEPDGPWYYEQVALSTNYRMTDIQAALISSQLDKLDAFSKRRKENSTNIC